MNTGEVPLYISTSRMMQSVISTREWNRLFGLNIFHSPIIYIVYLTFFISKV